MLEVSSLGGSEFLDRRTKDKIKEGYYIREGILKYKRK